MSGFTITYNPTFAVPIMHQTDLGNHQVSELGDGTICIVDNRYISDEAQEAVRLDHDEAYRLYVTLHALFTLSQDAA